MWKEDSILGIEVIDFRVPKANRNPVSIDPKQWVSKIHNSQVDFTWEKPPSEC